MNEPVFTAKQVGWAVGVALVHAYTELVPGAGVVEAANFADREGEIVLSKMLFDPKFLGLE